MIPRDLGRTRASSLLPSTTCGAQRASIPLRPTHTTTWEPSFGPRLAACLHARRLCCRSSTRVFATSTNPCEPDLLPPPAAAQSDCIPRSGRAAHAAAVGALRVAVRLAPDTTAYLLNLASAAEGAGHLEVYPAPPVKVCTACATSRVGPCGQQQLGVPGLTGGPAGGPGAVP